MARSRNQQAYWAGMSQSYGTSNLQNQQYPSPSYATNTPQLSPYSNNPTSSMNTSNTSPMLNNFTSPMTSYSNPTLSPIDGENMFGSYNTAEPSPSYGGYAAELAAHGNAIDLDWQEQENNLGNKFRDAVGSGGQRSTTVVDPSPSKIQNRRRHGHHQADLQTPHSPNQKHLSMQDINRQFDHGRAPKPIPDPYPPLALARTVRQPRSRAQSASFSRMSSMFDSTPQPDFVNANNYIDRQNTLLSRTTPSRNHYDIDHFIDPSLPSSGHSNQVRAAIRDFQDDCDSTHPTAPDVGHLHGKRLDNVPRAQCTPRLPARVHQSIQIGSLAIPETKYNASRNSSGTQGRDIRPKTHQFTQQVVTGGTSYDSYDQQYQRHNLTPCYSSTTPFQQHIQAYTSNPSQAAATTQSDGDRHRCSSCSKNYHDKSGLQKHIRIKHSPEGPVNFRCKILSHGSQCGIVFNRFDNMRKHWRTVHGERFAPNPGRRRLEGIDKLRMREQWEKVHI